MKQMQLLTAGFLFILAASISSCKSSRVWATKDKEKKSEKRDRDERNDDRYEKDYSYERQKPIPPPTARYYNYTKLVITPSAGFVMNKYPDGRFYHRNAQGFLYWKGHDNRFFLDRAYLNKVKYDSWEYEQWKKLYYFANDRSSSGR